MKAVFGFLAFVVLVIFIVVMIARGGNNTNQSGEVVPKLAEAASSDAEFRFTEAGPIIAEEDHYRIDITVSRNRRDVVVYQGYNNVQVASQTFSNSEAAFEEFLSALEQAGYTKERRTAYASEAGLCPTRQRYVFESNQFGEEFRRWTTDCVERGNFDGNFGVNRTLFQSQIPDYSTFIANTRRATGLNL